MLFQHSTSGIPFKQWLLKERENRLLLKLSGIAIVLQFAVFKFLYPFPNFMPPDSDSYVEAAVTNQLINLWPIGYSKFLRLFSCFTSSHIALVWFQYLLLQVSVLYLLFSIRYLLSPGKWLFRVLLAVSILNPLLPHICNFVSSDALFTALSLLWFTQLLWMLYQPNCNLLYRHAVVLLLAFMVRFNAVIYPCISIVVILLTHASRRTKLLGIGMIILLLGVFTGLTARQYYQQTHTIQYSAFGGWLIGSNALYGYAYAKLDPEETVPARFRPLHRMVNQHMAAIRKLPHRPDAEVAIYYFWDFQSPLVMYMNNKWKKDTTTTYFRRWASMAPLYAAYGRYLVQRHPLLYLQHFVWPNFIKYYAPPAKFMGTYNLGVDTVAPIIPKWFGWRSNKIHTYFKSKQIVITEPFTIISAVVDLLFIVCFITFARLGGLKRCTPYCRQVLWWTLLVWFGNMIFSVFTAPIELRYQLFPFMITTVFLGLLLHPLVVAGWKPQEGTSENHSGSLQTPAALIQVTQ
jgi:hypothetical protein